MRVRVKSNGQTSKVEVPGGTSTFGELKCAVAAQLFSGDPTAQETLQLSFNNKDVIEGDDQKDVKSLGITSGDLLWVVGPLRSAPAPAAPEPKRPREAHASGQAAAARAEAGPSGGGAAGGIINGGPPQARQAVAEEPVRMEEDGMQGGADTGTDVAPPVEEEEEEEEEEELPSAQAVPSYLLRALSQGSGGGGAGGPGAWAPSTPAHVLLLAAHAGMLEAGFEPTWVPEAGEPAAAAGACAGAGAASSPYSLPPSVRLSASVLRLPYRLPALRQGGEPAGTPPPGAGCEAKAEAGGACCVLQCSTLGPGAAVLVGSTPGRTPHTHQLPLLAGSFMQPAAAEGAGAGAAAAATPAPAAAAGAWDGQRLQVLGGQYALGSEGVRRLWRALKDGLAFPMLLAAYANAGLPAPAGLLALPEDLKLAVLSQLNALQLAALSMTCTELRHLASSDDLWKPLFEAEFPAAGYFYISQAQRRGYKAAFGACWRDRRQREEAARRQRRFMPALPNMGPRPPFYPPSGPLRMPGVIGGDYDRLPQPFFGGGPGMYGGGGLGGAMFGGSRRQGGRGGGGFRLF